MSEINSATSEEEKTCQLNGLTDGEDATMSDDPGGDEIECKMEPADWKVRVRSRNNPAQKERQESDTTHIPFRDWCTHCVTGAGRNHHAQKTDGLDGSLLHETKFSCNQSVQLHKISGVNDCEKKGRHQKHHGQCVLKKKVEEPWTTERVVKFTGSLGYHEITLKNDAVPNISAFKNRIAEDCKAEVTSQDAVKRDKQTNGLIENAALQLRGII